MGWAVRIAVIRFGAMGDVVVASAALDALLLYGPPDVRIAWVSKQAYASFFVSDPRIDQVFDLQPEQSLKALADRIAAWGPTHLLDLHGSIRSRRLSALVRRRIKNVLTVAWHKRSVWQSLKVRLRFTPYRPVCSTEQRIHNGVADALNNPFLRRPTYKPRLPRLHIDTARQQKVLSWLQKRGWESREKWAILSPWTRWGTKNWPLARYQALSDSMRAQDWGIIINAAPHEYRYWPELPVDAARSTSGLLSLEGLDLADVPVVFSLAQLSISGDTGPFHIARAVGTQAIGLFGSTAPTQFDLRDSTTVRVVQSDAVQSGALECAPCSLYGRKRCPQGHFKCLAEIEVPKVLEVLKDVAS